MKDILLVNEKFNLIQSIRLVHALAESDFEIAIPVAALDKFSILIDKFGLSFSHSDRGTFDLTDYCKLSHKEPLTSIGDLSRSLIFPSAITKYCRSIWSENRSYRYSFTGLITNNRKEVIEDWVKKNISHQGKLPDSNSRLSKIRKKILSKLGIDYKVKKRIDDLLIWSSERGRQFPVKSWDEEYFQILSKSYFVLCPSGDYTWTYRFFEAILCGAIPIVERSCKLYEGFKFFSFEDEAKKLEWTMEDAENNYALCLEKLTIPKVNLNEEIAKIIRESN